MTCIAYHLLYRCRACGVYRHVKYVLGDPSGSSGFVHPACTSPGRFGSVLCDGTTDVVHVYASEAEAE